MIRPAYRKILLVFIFLFCYRSGSAQLVDTINYSLDQKPKFFITLASFSTFIDHDFANFNGIRTGLNYNQRIKFGIGYFALANRAVVSDIDVDESGNRYITNGELHIHFVSLSAEYYFRNQYPWQFTVVPFQLGIGRAGYDYISRAQRKKISTPNELVVIYQPEVSAQYALMRWLGVGLTTGYRFALFRSDKLTQHLNAPTFSVDIRLFVDELYSMLIHPSEEE